MKKINNLNELAVAVTKLEGRKVQVNIAQVKEILSCLGLILKDQGMNAIALILKLIKS